MKLYINPKEKEKKKTNWYELIYVYKYYNVIHTKPLRKKKKKKKHAKKKNVTNS